MKRSVLTVMLLVFAFGLVGTAKPASAQLNFQLGYQFLRALPCGDCDEGANFPLGFDVNAGWPLRTMGPVRVIGDVNWARKGETDTINGVTYLTFGAGLRYTPPMMPRLGVQALVGIQRYSISDCDFGGCSGSDLMIQPGATFSVLPVNASWDMFVGGNFRIVLADPAEKAITLVVGLASK